MANENFTGYTESDPNGRLTVTASKVDISGLQRSDADTWVAKGFHFEHLNGDFEHKFEIYIDSSSGNECWPGGIWCLTDVIEGRKPIRDAGDNLLGVVAAVDAGGNPNIQLCEEHGGSQYTDTFTTASADLVYYCTFKRDESVGTYGAAYLYIRTGSHEGTLQDTLVLTLHEKVDFQYGLAGLTFGAGPDTDQFTGYIQNLDLQETEPEASTELDIPAWVEDDSANNAGFCGAKITTREISGTTYQVCIYYSEDAYVVIGKRTLPGGAWTLYHKADLGAVSARNHAGPAIEIDADGYIHLVFDTYHDGPANYYRSDNPISSWTGILTNIGEFTGAGHEGDISYPTFFRDPLGTLYFFHRQGQPADSDIFLRVYDEDTTSWAGVTGAEADGLIIEGHNEVPEYGAYLFGIPQFTSDWDGAGTGYMYIFWTWRTGASGRDSNKDVMCLKWDGTNWYQFDGTSQTMAATTTNADVVYSVGPNADMHNQNGFCLDNNDYPVVTLIKEDGSSIRQLYALYWDGDSWETQQITNLSIAEDFRLPQIVVDDSDVCYIFGGELNSDGDAIVVYISGAGDRTTWTKRIWHVGRLGIYHPQIDYERWRTDKTTITMRVNMGYYFTNETEWPVYIIERPPNGLPTESGFPDDWRRRQALTIQSSEIDEDLEGFSMLVQVSHINALALDPAEPTASQEDGGDIRFTSDEDGDNLLPIDLICWGHDTSHGSANADIAVRVRVPEIASGEDTTIYMWYYPTSEKTQPAAIDDLGQYQAYDGGWHFYIPCDDDLNDRCANQYNLTEFGNPSYTSGKFRSGVNLDSNDHLETPDRVWRISHGFTFMAWGSMEEVYGHIFCGDEDERLFQFRIDSGQLQLIRFDDGENVVSNFKSTDTTLNNGSLRHMATVFDGSDGYLYVDGLQDGTDSDATENNTANTEISIGARQSAQYWTGVLDELQFHIVPRSAAWVAAEHAQVNNPTGFATIGAVADVTPEEPEESELRRDMCNLMSY